MVAWFKSEDAGPSWKSAVGNFKGKKTKGSASGRQSSELDVLFGFCLGRSVVGWLVDLCAALDGRRSQV